MPTPDINDATDIRLLRCSFVVKWTDGNEQAYFTSLDGSYGGPITMNLVGPPSKYQPGDIIRLTIEKTAG